MEISVIPQGHLVWGAGNLSLDLAPGELAQSRSVPTDTMTPFRKTYP